MNFKRIFTAVILAALTLGLVAAPPARAGRRQLLFSPLCILQNPNYFIYDKAADKWMLNEVGANELFCAVANAGATGIRVLPWAPWEAHPYGLSSQFQPYRMNVDRTKFDLAAFNDYYFPLARRFIEIAKKYGLTTWFVLGDNCQFAGNYDRWSPWSNNAQGIGTFYESKAFPYFKKWFEKCIDEFAGLGVCWAWGNETNRPQMVDLARAAILPVVKARNLDFTKMTYGATMEEVDYLPPPAADQYPGIAGTLDWLKKLVGDTLGDKAKLSIWKEVHSIGGKGYPKVPNRLHQALYWWARTANNGIRIWLSNDGVFDGNSTCDVEQDGAVTKRRPSTERMAEIVQITMAYANDFTYEHLPKTKDLVCITATLRAMYRAMTGKDPETKYHYEPPPPPIEYVTLAVCEISKLLPNPYCPKVIEEQFVKGEEPTQICTVHKKPDEPPAPECSCGAWLDTEGGTRKADVWRWIKCLFGGPKRCK